MGFNSGFKELTNFHRIVAPSILSSNTHRASSWTACQF